ncbi:MAG: nickel pincer cofactor biosynthesis protein LarC [Candidatus Hydrogenedentota bacterium]|nr:MAG: nickel pincer cofactor biosynthesis protein LarC [Candidatus Hydrogenedentota bacterium]
MFLGLLIELGADCDILRHTIRRALGPNADLETSKIIRRGIQARKAVILWNGEDSHKSRDVHSLTLDKALTFVEKAALPEDLSKTASRIFHSLFSAEALVHGKSPRDIHLHEAGELDAVGEILGVVVALDQLSITNIYHTPLPLPASEISIAHGRYPNPAPAVIRLLEGRSFTSDFRDFEFVTPTGAVLLKELAQEWSGFSGGRLVASGYGAGSRDPEWPNVLRGLLFEPNVPALQSKADLERIAVLETDVDHLDGETLAFLLNRLFECGALDAVLIPILMKKGRPGYQIRVLSPLEKILSLQEILFKETGSLGIRVLFQDRWVVSREIEICSTPYGPVRFKISPFGARPEFEDCRRIAKDQNLPLRKIRQELVRLFSEKFSGGSEEKEKNG